MWLGIQWELEQLIIHIHMIGSTNFLFVLVLFLTLD